MDSVIDLRSDTVTRPTPGMRKAMAEADTGDDVYGEDPVVNRLERMVAELFQKEAAVYNCSGTQSNQMAVWAHCSSGDEILIESTAHVANYEAGAPAALSGVTLRTIPGRNGILDVADLEGKVRPSNFHFCTTRVVALENTTNAGGGRVYPQETIDRICDWAHGEKLQVHVDGARLFNAAIASGLPVSRICRDIDTISVCFSKGLGCPMGSILIGPAALMHRARKARKMFGGGLRQAGVVAAAAIYALENNVNRLADDHLHAKQFADRIRGVEGLTVDAPEDVQSNLVFFQLDPKLGTPATFSARLKEHGVLINPLGPQRLRACTHLDVNRQQVLHAADVVIECVRQSASNGPVSNVDHVMSAYSR